VHDLLRAAEVERAGPLLDFLTARNDLRLIGPRDATRRAPTVAVDAGTRAAALAAALGREGIGVGSGNFYAQRPLAAMGVVPEVGVLRMSFLHYTSAAEVDRLIRALERLLA
jgi:selenocysteine lyase/cysteine desulfurase